MSHLVKLSSSCHRTTLQDTNSDPQYSLNTKLKLVLTHVTIFLPLSHIVDQLGQRQKAYKIAGSAGCRIKPNSTDPTHSKDKLESITYSLSPQPIARHRMPVGLPNWSKAVTDRIRDYCISQLWDRNKSNKLTPANTSKPRSLRLYNKFIVIFEQ